MLHQTQQFDKTSIISISIDKRIWSVYSQLQKAIDNMDKKVQTALKKNQSQFLYAYRLHINKIKKQLEEIKNKSQQQQKMFSSNDRIRFLQKQNNVFREQTVKLYEKMEQKTIQLNLAKNKMIEAEKISKKLQEENKNLVIQLKRMQVLESQYIKNISILQDQLSQHNSKLEKLQQKRIEQRRRRDYMESASYREKASSLAKSRDHSPRQIPTLRNQLQEWFLECVKSVKKQIQQRKSNFDAIDLSKVISINQFRLVDKLKLFEMVLQNQKLLTWLYHKIFPDKLDKINNYLTQNVSIPLTDTDINSEKGPTSSRYGSTEQNLQLPKVPAKRVPSYSLRNQIIIKNGKMNISLA